METSMNRLLIATAAMLVLGAPLALAESNTMILPTHKEHREHKDKVTSVAMDEKCQALGYEFDTTAGKYKTAQSYLHAMQVAAQGKSLCAAHNDNGGIQKYDLAFKMLGVTPQAS
jgi:Ni/Co efflux regulator RcnB